MDEGDWRQTLEQEGFSEIALHNEDAGNFHAPHTHVHGNTHVVLEGDMFIQFDGTGKQLNPGDRLDIPGGQIHSIRIGSAGCVYLVGNN